MAEIISRAIEVCPFRIRNDKPEFLLIRRSATEPRYPGMWQFVTGSVEEGEKAYESALRELKEETGSEGVRLWAVPSLTSFYDVRTDRVNLVPQFAAQFEPGFEVRLSAEHSAFEWLPYAAAMGRLVWPGQKACLEIVRAYIVGGEEASRLLEIPR
ncbi:MAG TPA: NUDIX domain-containing protein [Bacteroidota bacterium]|nr:NUDIX domain-containing protein [Bacteroidota bacterium]